MSSKIEDAFGGMEYVYPPLIEFLTQQRRQIRAWCPRVTSLDNAFEVVAPRPDALMESLRATGYSLPDAVSDLIDNSITAGARNIWLKFHWAGADSRVCDSRRRVWDD